MHYSVRRKEDVYVLRQGTRGTLSSASSSFHGSSSLGSGERPRSMSAAPAYRRPPEPVAGRDPSSPSPRPNPGVGKYPDRGRDDAQSNGYSSPQKRSESFTSGNVISSSLRKEPTAAVADSVLVMAEAQRENNRYSHVPEGNAFQRNAFQCHAFRCRVMQDWGLP